MTKSNGPLQRLLGGDHLAALRKRLRQRFERAPLDDDVDTIRMDRLTREEHAALVSLLGRPPRYTNSLRIDVGHVDAALQRASIATSLRDALEQLDGPITHLATARLQLRALWLDTIATCQYPGLVGLLETPSGLGLLKRLARQTPSVAGQLCRHADAVLHRLPANGTTRAQLAAESLGDAHALDDGRAVATLVLSVLRRTASSPDDEDNEYTAQQDGRAERDRDIWARAGVLVNELARPALFLNLPTREAENYGRPPGEPAYASLRVLLRSRPSWDVADRPIYVCENANLLAIAADHWGADCAPLVCTDGMPGAAQRCLLSQLAEAGARLCYHGDFDWPGLRIGNHVMREHGAQPWRFGAVDYAAAIRSASSLGTPLAGAAVDALWNANLTTMMGRHRISIAEEALAGSLLRDLDDR